MWQNRDIDILVENYELKTLSELSNLLNKNTATICWKANKLNLKRKHKRIYNLDIDFFTVPTNINSYWAGFIAADGHVRKDNKTLEISLHEKDREILNQFKTDIKYGGRIKYRKNLHQYRLIIKSRKICTDLKNNFNIINNKSLTLLPPIELDLNNSLFFIKGLIDGDGCIKHNNKNYLIIDINGTREMLVWVLNILRKVDFLKSGKSKILQTSSIYRLSLHGKNAIFFGKLFKQLPTFNLERKWNKI